LHMIFSTGCTWFQHWQSEMLLGTAFDIGQRGRITRIVSGCYDDMADMVEGHSDESLVKNKKRHQSNNGASKKSVPISELKKSVHPDFGLFITPSFPGAKEFPWLNKAASINYFMEHTKAELDRFDETVIAVLDPDFVFVSPLTQAAGTPETIIQTKPSASGIWHGGGTPINLVQPGRPVGQRYDMGGKWVSRYDMKAITGDENTAAAEYTPAMMRKYFDVGPPFMVHRTDMGPLAKLWSQFMPRILEQSPEIKLESDMYAYNVAAAHLGLRHTLLEHYMVSNPDKPGEGWDWVDPFVDKNLNCNSPESLLGQNLAGHRPLPSIVHLAHNFKAPVDTGWPSEWMFHKGHVPEDIFACGTPLIKEAPADLLTVSTKADLLAQNTKPTRPHLRARSAWILCNVVSRLNAVILKHKTKFCKAGFETRKLVRLIQSKQSDQRCRPGVDKWCWRLAEIEDLGPRVGKDGWTSTRRIG